MIKNKYFEDFNLGDNYILPSRTQTSGIFSMFQGVSGDNDPIHMMQNFANKKDIKICLLMVSKLCLKQLLVQEFSHQMLEIVY